MFHEICIKRMVVVPPHRLHTGALMNAAILTQLLEDLKLLQCSQDHGYYVIPTTVQDVGEGSIRPRTGSVVFPLEFNCLVFMPHKGEILLGSVTKVYKHGCFLSCGPMKDAFLHVHSMKGFEYNAGQSPEFSSFTDGSGCEIKKDTTLRFRILGVKWVEEERHFMVLATLDGDYLGPVEMDESLI